MNRGARRQDIFLDKDDRQFFIGLLSGLEKRFDTRVVSYCLMSNHYHLAVRCPEPALSRTMQWLGSNYTRRFNAKRHFDGPMCKSRFRSVEITDDAQLLAVVRYIHRNPLALSSALDLTAYEWSSHGAYVGARDRPSWLETRVPLSFFDGDRTRFQDTVETALAFDEVANRRPKTQTAAPPVSRARKPPSRGAIERAVAAAAAASVSDVRRRRAGVPNHLNDCVILLWLESENVSADAVASAFDFASAASANRAIARARTRATADAAFRALIDRARSGLPALPNDGSGSNRLRPSA